MIIDVHYHIGRGHYLNDIFQSEATVADVYKHQKESGIDKTVVFPVKYKHYRKANEFIAQTVKEHDNMIGFGRVIGNAPDVVEEMDYAINTLGLKGLKIHYSDGGMPERPCLDKAEELGVPIIFHTGMGLAPATFEAILKGYPTIPIILAHIGTDFQWATMFDYPEQAMRLAAEYENAYVDTSTVFLQYVMERAVKICGPSKMMFGSDGPWFHPAINLRMLDLLPITEDELKGIKGLNFAKLIGLKV